MFNNCVRPDGYKERIHMLSAYDMGLSNVLFMLQPRSNFFSIHYSHRHTH